MKGLDCGAKTFFSVASVPLVMDTCASGTVFLLNLQYIPAVHIQNSKVGRIS
jgi:hypothetical protein